MKHFCLQSQEGGSGEIFRLGSGPWP